MTNEKRNGTIKSQRLPKDLLDSPFLVDNQPVWYLLGYIVKFLEQINYYNLENEVQGNWKELIEKDPIIFMISIINEPTLELDKMLETKNITEAIKYDDSKRIMLLLKWYDKIKHWHKILLEIGENNLAFKLENVLSNVLTDQKVIILKFKEELAAKNDTGNSKEIEKALNTFKRIIQHIQEFTKKHMEKNMLSQNTHLPHSALYISFALLYKNIQSKLNCLPRKHLDFYYKDILKQKPRDANQTRATVVFELLPTVKTSLIEKGTSLSAGKILGASKDVLFETSKPLLAHQVSVAKMNSLFFNNNPYINIGTNKPIISSALKSRMIDTNEELDSADMFVFGASKTTVQNAQVDKDRIANIGFIIASPTLVLTEGRREIELKFNLKEKTAEKSFWKLLNEISTNRKISLQRTFSMVFDTSFSIFHTSKKGWNTFKNYKIDFCKEDNSFTITLILESTAPALELGQTFSELFKWPAIKILLNPYAPIYGYSFFKGLQIKTIDIQVSVKDIKNIFIYNNVAKIGLGKSFEIFGPFPKKGSYLLLGKSELFQKHLETLKINLQWESLPMEYGGFSSYYNGYSQEISNKSFVVEVTALSNSYWLPLDKKNIPTYSLFSTTACVTPEGYTSEKLAKKSTLVLTDFQQFQTEIDYSLKDPLKYTINSQSGFLKISLSEPDFAFGNDVYQQEFTQVATYNTKNKHQLPFPKKPFIPKLNGVSLDYEASDTLSFDEILPKENTSNKNVGQFLHIRPSGLDYVISDHKVNKFTLMPNFEKQAYLFIGLKGISENITLTIFFYFLRSGTTVKIGKNELKWEYYQFNKWVPLSADQIINDETGGLTKSGIVELTLPKVETFNTSNLEELFWLRISTERNAEHYPKIKAVYTNAVQAYCLSDETSVMGVNLLAGSINKVIGKVPDIKKVMQPATSYAGTPSEDVAEFYTRVSERLRHKDRAVSIWDYERLLMQAFDGLSVVKCTNYNANFHPEAGKVKVIVLSERWTNDEVYYFKKETLEAMQLFLKKHSSPFLDLEVLNPTPEYLLVNCSVEFKKGDKGGYYLEKLNQAISNYLSPTKNILHGMGGIGGKVVPNMVLNFIENLSYIKKVNELSIEHIINSDMNDYRLEVYNGGAEIAATMPWSILIPVSKHHIFAPNIVVQKIKDTIYPGIGEMEIGTDFILNKESEKFSMVKMDSPLSKPDNAIFVLKKNLTNNER